MIYGPYSTGWRSEVERRDAKRRPAEQSFGLLLKLGKPPNVLQEKLMDTVERLRSLNDGLLMCGNDYSDVLLDAAKDVESLRQQLDAAEANCQCELIKLEQQLAESQARGDAIRDAAINLLALVDDADAVKSLDAAIKEYDKRDSTALESAISQAMREALLGAINEWEKPYGLTDGSRFIERLRRMAEKLK